MSYISCSFPGVIWGCLGVYPGVEKVIMVGFGFPFQFNELREVMIYSSSLSGSFVRCVFRYALAASPRSNEGNMYIYIRTLSVPLRAPVCCTS